MSGKRACKSGMSSSASRARATDSRIVNRPRQRLSVERDE